MFKGIFKKATVILLASMLAFTQPTSSFEVQAKSSVSSSFSKYLKKNGLYYKNMSKAYRPGYKTAKKTYKAGNFNFYGMNSTEYTGKYFYMADHVAAWTGTLQNLSISDAQRTYNVAKSLSKKAKRKKSKYQKAAAIHDALVKHTSYQMGPYQGQSAYEALVNRQAVCAGYSRAFKLMCDICGVPCMCVYGYAGGGTGGGAHQWNIIKLDDGKWYEVDCTFDDPLGGSPNRNFFCLSTAKMSSGMTPQGMSYYHQRTGMDELTTAFNKCIPMATSTKHDKKKAKDLVVK
ncbi:transglutaminase domain-containing protein [Butyrivibrio sp. AE3004]|uniref:transglutaminase domain-containing protein n=1 Tax=Butyrivibrio sp. AE3004 TaxID=1506994 RepID=UPI0005628B08|nr:transglutaminase domain-containing protein [Butyrivibrio sp. AE3004]